MYPSDPDRPDRRPPDGGPDLSSADRSPCPVLASVLEEVVRVVAGEDDGHGPRDETAASGGRPEPDAPARRVEEDAQRLARVTDDLEELAESSADLLYHLVVLWRAAGLNPDAVGERLAARRSGPSGAPGENGEPA